MKAISRPLLAGAAVLVAGVIIATLIAAQGLERDLVAARVAEVEGRAAWLVAELEEDAGTDWPVLAGRLAARADGRVVLLDATGHVLGDSARPGGAAARLDDGPLEAAGVLVGLPEVARALAGGRGERFTGSASDVGSLVHVAHPVTRAPVAAVRLSSPLGAVAGRIQQTQRLYIWFSLATIGIAVLVLVGASLRVARVGASITASLDALAGGKPALEGDAAEELGALGRSLAQVQGELTTRVAALTSEHARLAGVLTAMANGVLLLDAAGRVALVNPALREMLILPKDAVGRPLLEVIRRADLKQLLDEARRSDEPAQRELELDGRRLLVRAAHVAAGMREMLVLCVDVTDLRRLESHRRDFVANVSHELRTPVTAVRSAAETLRLGAADDPVHAERFLDIIERNAERLQHLVEDLLDLARVERGELKLALEIVDAADALAHATSALDDEARRRGIELATEAAPGLHLRADRRGLDQVLSNLLDNALKYGPAGGRVTARAEAWGDRVRLSVSDSGPGIEARHLPRLFERFYRVDAGRSRELGGTGLGLSIVKHLVEAMGGEVGVESAPGRGTTFWVALPASSAPDA